MTVLAWITTDITLSGGEDKQYDQHTCSDDGFRPCRPRYGPEALGFPP